MFTSIYRLILTKIKIVKKSETSTTTSYLTVIFCDLPRLGQPMLNSVNKRCGLLLHYYIILYFMHKHFRHLIIILSAEIVMLVCL